MSRLGKSSHGDGALGKQSSEGISASSGLEQASPGHRAADRDTAAAESQDFKDQLLCELEWQRTVSAAQIQELQKIRTELEREQASFIAFHKHSPIGYVTLTEHGRIIEANPAAAALFGVEVDKLKRLPFTMFIHRGDVRQFLTHLRRCATSSSRKVCTELRLREPAEEPHSIQIICAPTGEAGEVGERVFMTAIVDLTDRMRGQQELAEAKEFSESIVETVSQPLAVLDDGLRIVSVNRAFVEFFKKSVEYARGRVFEVMLNLWWSGNELRSALEKVLVTDKPLENFQIETEMRDVGKRVLLLNARRLHRNSSERALLLVAMEDITARKQAEEQMRLLNQELETRVASRTEALKKSYEQMESFCYSIAHDLRAPLRSMTGFSSILLDDYGPQLDTRGKDYIGRIHESAGRMDQLIKDLLNYGRLNTAGLEIQDVNLDETLRLLLMHSDNEIKEKRATITKTGILPRVRGHPVVLQTILGNLLSNAMKFMAPGVNPVIVVSAEQRGEFARIWIEDNGIGIAAQNRTKIFGVFQRLHASETYPGTGIGLAIVYKGIERMGGKVGVESELNKGSRFWIELPAVGVEKKEPPMATRKSPAAQFVSP